MGLILDSTVLIQAERTGLNARQALSTMLDRIGSDEVGISVVSALELAHGVERAEGPERRSKREAFLHELLRAVPVYPVTLAVALRAGRIDGASAAGGVRVSMQDLLIGVTALEAGFDVATANVRHFGLIAGLTVVRL